MPGVCPSTGNHIIQLIQEGEVPRESTLLLNEWEKTLSMAGGGPNKRLIVSYTLADPIVIPVVVHVLENPSVLTVDDAYIRDAIQTLNNRFDYVDLTQVRPVFRPVAGTTRFRFELAKRTDTCNPTPGIVRYAGRDVYCSTGVTGCRENPLTGGQLPWSPERYLNIYIANLDAFVGGAASKTSVAILPGHVNAIDHDLAHEVAHYFGLEHVDDFPPLSSSSPSCLGSTEDTCSIQGDEVCDTPAFKVALGGTRCPDANSCVDTLPTYFDVDPPDPYENYMASFSGGGESMFTFGQVDRTQAPFILLGTGGKLASSNAFSLPVAGPDLWIRDGEGDDGSEPNNIARPWLSNDIWVRHADDGIAIHENPKAGISNYVYVRVRNRGCTGGIATGTVHLYWASASTNLTWPGSWDGTKTLGSAPLGNSIGTAPVAIGPNDSQLVKLPWMPPDPSLYPPGVAQSHFCLLAYVGDPPPPSSDMPALVRGSRHIAQKNISIIGDQEPYDGYLAIGGTSDASIHQLLFTVPTNPPGTAGSIFDWATVTVDLGPVLYQLWKQNGAQGDNISDPGTGTTVTLVQSGAALKGIPLTQADILTVRVVVTPLTGSPGNRTRPDVYLLDVTQQAVLADGSLRDVGGQLMQLKIVTSIFPPSPG
jgi:hypothetical protein